MEWVLPSDLILLLMRHYCAPLDALAFSLTCKRLYGTFTRLERLWLRANRVPQITPITENFSHYMCCVVCRVLVKPKNLHRHHCNPIWEIPTFACEKCCCMVPVNRYRTHLKRHCHGKGVSVCGKCGFDRRESGVYGHLSGCVGKVLTCRACDIFFYPARKRITKCEICGGWHNDTSYILRCDDCVRKIIGRSRCNAHEFKLCNYCKQNYDPVGKDHACSVLSGRIAQKFKISRFLVTRSSRYFSCNSMSFLVVKDAESIPQLLRFLDPPITVLKEDTLEELLVYSGSGRITKTCFVRHCHYCATTISPLAKCSGCYRTLYCSADCQKAHWRFHKLECLS